jgi:mRNA interferase RelE/StbE
MPYAIRLAPAAERQLRRSVKFHYFSSERVVPRINELADNPRPDGCKKLAGHDNRYRIRIGDMRVVYQVDDARAEVLVLVIAHRRDVYRDLQRLLRG